MVVVGGNSYLKAYNVEDANQSGSRFRARLRIISRIQQSKEITAMELVEFVDISSVGP